jgi:hypothetical protein
VIRESLSTEKRAAASSPKRTPVAPVNPDPVIVTDSPPAVEPCDGSTPVTTGAADTTVVLVVEVLVVVEDVEVVVVELVVVVGSPGERTGPTGSALCIATSAALSARTDTLISRPRSSSATV